MICYQDRTFCPFYRSCKSGEKCSRALTPEVEKAASDFGLPISVFSEKPECYK